MIAYGKSDRGAVRPTNQDAYEYELRPHTAFFAVCDGMGGANAGNVASRFAIDAFMETLRKQLPDGPDSRLMRGLLSAATETANRRVFEMSCSQPEFRGMGTTLVGGIATENLLTLVNVGDSRAYRIGKGGAEQLTADHSYVEEMMRSGRLSREAARNHPKKNLITRAVGVDPEVDCDLYDIELAEDETLLLCSDGLTGMVRDERIAELVLSAAGLEDAVYSLLREAIAAGGHDNITVLLFTRGVQAAKE